MSKLLGFLLFNLDFLSFTVTPSPSPITPSLIEVAGTGAVVGDTATFLAQVDGGGGMPARYETGIGDERAEATTTEGGESGTEGAA